jgi:prepilin-type N-terminal cleavage/methylation domain-containing protein
MLNIHSLLKSRFRGNHSAGFTMVEIIIAIAILAFGIILVYDAFSSGVNLTYNAAPKFTAVYLAQEGLEIVRNLRDNNFIAHAAWDQGLTGSPCDNGCQVDNRTADYTQLVPYDGSPLGLDDYGFYTYASGSTPTTYKREITISPVLGLSNALNVQVTVFWDYNGKSYTFTSNEHLYNWY